LEERGGSPPPEDVMREQQRVQALLEGPAELHDSITIDQISKVCLLTMSVHFRRYLDTPFFEAFFLTFQRSYMLASLR
jgi:hypothetical protein